MVQQVRAVRKKSTGAAGLGEEGEEMEGLRGRSSGGVVAVEEGNAGVGVENGSQVHVGSTDEAGRTRRRASPLPGEAGFRSSAL